MKTANPKANVSSLSGQTPVTIGNAEVGPYPDNMTRRNAFRGPGCWNFDIALSKTFAFTERFKFMLRADINNLFNRANLAIYGGEADLSAGFINAGKFG